MGGNRNILITGGTGTIGGRLVQKLISKGYNVRILTLPQHCDSGRLSCKNVDVRIGNISEPADVEGICRGIDTVVHLAAVIIADDESLFDSVNIMGTGHLLADAQKYGVGHFVHISSASVCYPKMTPYSRSKRIGEEYVRKSGIPYTIVRPTLVYGETGGMEFDMFVNYLQKWPVIPFIGNGKAMKRPVYAGDLIDGLERIASLETGNGKIYNLSGGSSISMIDFARLCLTVLGKPNKPIVHLPVFLCIMIAAAMKRLMKKPLLTWNMIAGVIQDSDLDPSQAVTDLGYAPHGVEKKLKDCFPRRSTGY